MRPRSSARLPKASRPWGASGAGAVLVLIATQSAGCSHKADFVCDVLARCGLLEASEAQCVANIQTAQESALVNEVEVAVCLDCVIENSCELIEDDCFAAERPCEKVVAAIRLEFDAPDAGGPDAGSDASNGNVE